VGALTRGTGTVRSAGGVPSFSGDVAEAARRAFGPSRRLFGLRIGVYGSGGAPWHHLALLALHGAAVSVVRAEDVAAGVLDELDAVVFPGGGALAMAGLMAPLGEEGATAVRAFVERGGVYVGSCAGSVIPAALEGVADEGLPAARCLRLVQAPLANLGDPTLGGLASPGVGRIVARVDTSHPLASGLPERLEVVHYNGPFFDVARAAPDVSPFAWPEAATDGFTPAERFLETPDAPFYGETTFERCVRLGAATGVTQPLGRGRTVLFGSHPEFGLGRLGLGWGAASELLVRALEAVLQPRPSGGAAAGASSAPVAPATWAVVREAPGASPGELARSATSELRRAAARFAALASTDASSWLEPGYAASFHGEAAASAWAGELSAAAQACDAAGDDLVDLAHDLGENDVPWLDDAQRPGQDFGAMGLRQLLATIHGQLDGAEALVGTAPLRPAHAYDLFDTHPFHLAMGSYLSAAGMAAAALLTVTVMHARRGGAGPHAGALLWL
jgi:hypothetical protein